MIRTSNALMILVLVSILAASFTMQLFDLQLPCAYCILQRSAMIGTATGLAMNLRFGIAMRHYALSLFCALAGGAIALRQIGLHACPQFPIFGNPVLGLSLYTWSFLIFASSILAIASFLFLHKGEEEKKTMNLFEKFAVGTLFTASIILALLTFHQCGLGDCEGKANAKKYTKRDTGLCPVMNLSHYSPSLIFEGFFHRFESRFAGHT
jgi:disulfide bond formation protein DsbB